MADYRLRLVGPIPGPVHQEEWLQVEGAPRILIVTGYAGSGKTTLANWLAYHYVVEWLSRYTTRPPRPREKPGTEYLFVSPLELQYLRDVAKTILTWKIARGESDNPDGSKYERGTPKPQYFPKGGQGVDFILGILSPRLYRAIKRRYPALNMKAVFLAGRDEDLIMRIRERKGGDWVRGHGAKNERYRKLELEEWYHRHEAVIDTTSLPPEDVAWNTVHKLFLPQPHVVHP